MFIKGENNEQSIFSPIVECFNSCRKGEKNGDIGEGGLFLLAMGRLL